VATVTGVQATEVQSLACALPVGLPTAKGACATKTNLEIDKHMPAPRNRNADVNRFLTSRYQRRFAADMPPSTRNV
jgi:hypothetical protein